MREFHTPGPWDSDASTEDYQGHCIATSGRIVAATFTRQPADITREDIVYASLNVAASAMLAALRQNACDANFKQKDGAMILGQRLLEIERDARVAIALYQAPLCSWSRSDG